MSNMQHLGGGGGQGGEYRGGCDQLAHELIQAAHEPHDGALEDVRHLADGGKG